MAAAVMFLGCGPLYAEDDEPHEAPPEAQQGTDIATRELWSGSETSRGVWAFYTGLTVAPEGIMVPGLRFRLAAGMSTYPYTDAFVQGRAAQPFADLLAGYQWQLKSLTLKAFAGATGYADIRTLEQALDLWGQRRIGGKATLEAWWSISDSTWTSLDLAYNGAQQTLWTRARLGLSVLPQVSLGPEVGTSGAIANPGARLGAFLRLAWEQGEVAASAGIATETATSATFVPGRDPSQAVYATVTWLQRF